MAATLRADEVEILVQESGSVVGGRIQRIATPAPDVFRLQVFGGGTKSELLLHLGAHCPRVHLTQDRRPSATAPPPFLEFLRREIDGGRIAELATVPGERIVLLRVECLREGILQERLLVMELFGHRPNLLVLDEEQNVLGLLRTMKPPRTLIRKGARYSFPDPRPSKKEQGPPFLFLEDPRVHPVTSAFEEWVLQAERDVNEESLKSSTLRALKKRLKKDTRLLESLERDLAEAARGEEKRNLGELLMQNLNTIPRGASTATLKDYSSGEVVDRTITLDPKRPVLEQAQDLFKQAKKADRSLGKVAIRHAGAAERVELLQDFIDKVTATDDLEALRELHAAGVTRGWLPPPQKDPAPNKRSKEKAQPERKPYRTFRSESGIEILVGRTARDNDELSLRIARGNETWLHVADYAGSHVVIRSTDEIPHETLKDAALLALYYSKTPKGSSGEVSYTLAKYVKKFKGAHPGQVQLAQRKSIRMRFDQERLDRLLSSGGSRQS